MAIAGKRGERTYRYSVVLGDTIDPETIEAKLDKGVLTVRAHKRAEAKPRKRIARARRRARPGYALISSVRRR